MQVFTSPTPSITLLAYAAASVLAVVCLSAGQTFLLPLFVALLLAMLLQLPLQAMQRARVPRALAILALVATLGGIILVLTNLIADPLQRFASDYRTIGQNLQQKLLTLEPTLSEATEVGEAIASVGDEVTRSLEDPNVQQVVVRESNFLVRAASSVAASATTLIATLSICGFILALRSPMLTLATMPFGDRSKKLAAARTWRLVEQQISQYFLITTCINIGLGTLVGGGLYAMGVPMAAFWGVLVGLLNYMPFIGPTIGAIALLAFCVLQFDTWWMMLAPAALYLSINFVEANFVTPSLVGRRTEIPTLAIILCLFFWGWLWGFVGLLIAIPFLVIVKAISQHVGALEPICRVLTPRKSFQPSG
ncbi:MAG: AI-2E family transporter [Pseudomonadota bacterium]